jgi:hypothetical protein
MQYILIFISLAVVVGIFYHLLNKVGVNFTAHLVSEHSKYKEDLVKTRRVAEEQLLGELTSKRKEFDKAEKAAILEFKSMMSKTTDETISIIQNIEDSIGDDPAKKVLIAAYKVITVSGNSPRHQEDVELAKAVVKHKDSGGPYLSKQITLPKLNTGGGLN